MTLTAPSPSEVKSTRRGTGSPLEVLPLCLILGFAALGLLPLGDPDVWWHLRTGELVINEGFTRTDPWSWTSTEPWLLHEWLSDLVMYLAYRVGGYHGVILLRAAMLALIAALILRSCRNEAGPVICSVVGVIALVAMFPFDGERPQLVSFALLAWILPRMRLAIERRRPPWELVPIVWIWANLHLLWVTALVLYAALVLGLLLELGVREWRRLVPFAAVGALSGLVTMLTPNGPTLLLMPLKAVGAPGFLPTEFLPPSVSDPFTACALALLFVVLVGWAKQSGAVPVAEICFVLMATLIGLTYVRTVPVLVIAIAPLAARTLQTWSARQTSSFRLGRADSLLAGALMVVAVILGASWMAQLPGVKQGAPYASTKFLEELPGRAKVINEYELGGWLLWAGRDTSPGVDGRAETKTVGYLNAYVNTLKLQGNWRAFVNDSGADAAWLRKEAPLVEGLRLLGWRTVHEDDFTLILLPPEDGRAG